MRVRSYKLIAMGLFFVLAYQNCSQPQSVQFSGASKAGVETEENGRPYDGKIYVLTGDVCADGTNIHARIVVKSSSNADLVRENCHEITPVALAADDFLIDSNRPGELVYQSQTFLNVLIGTKLDVSQFYNDGGFAWLMMIDFPIAPDDDANITRSTLQLYEDGKPIGPAHTRHDEIRTLGQGRFSHWFTGVSTLRFSSSDNTDPRANGRTYTWTVR